MDRGEGTASARRRRLSEEGWRVRAICGLGGALAWPSLMRKLHRIDPGFRD